MDLETLAAYDRGADAFAKEWLEQPAATDLHATIREYFRLGRTADVGCGSGRDTAWLGANGFPATGYDASEALLRTARERYPEVPFVLAALPELAGVPENTFKNVLCETVIMHLPADEIAPSVRKLLAILEPHGMLYLSWRVTKSVEMRDPLGRLYAAFDVAVVREALTAADVLLDEERTSASSGKTIHRIVARGRGRSGP
jgi:SAM-dependent methyltransferase